MRVEGGSSTPRSPTRDSSYEVGTARRVRAFHVMPGMEGPEGVLHDHDYRIEVVVHRRELRDGMVCDLDVLDAALAGVVARLDGQDLEMIRPDGADAVTVEVFARWTHGALAAPVRAAGGEALTVRVWESDVAYGGYSAPLAGEPANSP